MEIFKSTFYNTFRTFGHPALGGIAMFTLAGILLELDPKVAAVAFILYSGMWFLMLQVLEFFGWDCE